MTALPAPSGRAHTPVDGDLVFALATGRSGIALELDDAIDLYAAASATDGARHRAGGLCGAPAAGDLFPVWRDVWRARSPG